MAIADADNLFVKPKRKYTKKLGQDRVTNGKSLFFDRQIDQRSAIGRRVRNLHEQFVKAAGGADAITPAIAGHIRRAVLLSAELERQEGEWVKSPGSIDINAYGTLASHLKRICDAIPGSKVVVVTTPPKEALFDYLADTQAADAAKANAANGEPK